MEFGGMAIILDSLYRGAFKAEGTYKLFDRDFYERDFFA